MGSPILMNRIGFTIMSEEFASWMFGDGGGDGHVNFPDAPPTSSSASKAEVGLRSGKAGPTLMVTWTRGMLSRARLMENNAAQHNTTKRKREQERGRGPASLSLTTLALASPPLESHGPVQFEIALKWL